MNTLRYLLLAVASLALVSTRSVGAEKPYTDASVWNLTFVRTKYGHDEDYLRSLQRAYKVMMESAKKEGLVVSYKIMTSDPTHKEDWDILLMVEYKNMAALDGLDAKMDPHIIKSFGSESARDKTRDQRAEFREILGTKLCREIVLK
jgi:hypothetical protein